MKSKVWKKKIINACITIGTYRKEYDSVIETLSAILEERDKAYEEYIKDYEGKVIYQYPNRIVGINPALNVWDTLNKSALTYWKDLGLTPSGFKKATNKNVITKKNYKTLSDTINEIELELDSGLSD